MRNCLRSVILSIILLFGSSLLFGSNEPEKVTVYYKNGQKKDFAFSAKPSITFQFGKAVFSCPNEELVVDFSDIAGVAFTQNNIPVYVPAKQGGAVTQHVTLTMTESQQEPDPGPGPDPVDPQPTYVDISETTITLPQVNYNYTGSPIEPELTITYQGETLERGTDYTVTYAPDNIQPGTVTMTISGCGSFNGSVTKTLTIVRTQTVKAIINGEEVEPVYTTLTENVIQATYNTDYGSIKIVNCYASSGEDVYLWVTPAKGYTIAKTDITPELNGVDPVNLNKFREYAYVMPATGNVTIDAVFHHGIDLANAKVTLPPAEELVYTGDSIMPTCTVTYGDEVLTAGADYTVTYNHNIHVGKASISIAGQGNYMGVIDTTFVINKALLTVKADALTMVYGGTMPELTYQITGFVGNDSESCLTKLPSVTTEASLDSPVGDYAITVNGAESDNYDFDYVDAILKVVGVDLGDAEVTFANDDLVYTGDSIKPTFTVQRGLATLTGDRDYVATFANNRNAGTALLTITGQGNYAGTVDTTFVINKAQLTVKAETQTKVYGEENPELTFSITGFKGEDTEGCLTKLPEAITEATAESPAGEYAITVGGAEADNYSFDYVDATLTVAAADVSRAVITFANDSLVYTGDSIKPAFTVQRGLEMLKEGIDFVATYANNTNAGIATMTVEGKGNYTAKIDTTFVINKALLTVKTDTQTKVYGEENPELTFSITGFLGEDTDSCLTKQPEAVTEATGESPVGEYAITIGGAEADNYSFGYVDAMLSVTPRSIADALVVMTTDSVAYTSKPVLPEFTVQCGSVTLAEGTDYTVTATDDSEVGIATLTVEGTGNYEGKIDTTFVIFLKPSISVIINGKQITPDVDELLNNSSPATFVSEQGKIMVDNYYALAGSTVMLTVTPNQPYYIFKENISGIDLVGNNPTDSTMQQHYRYIVPQNGEVVIEAEFVIPSAISNQMVDDLRFEVVDGKMVRVLGAREVAPVSVFDARGQQVAAEVVRSDRELIVRLARQPQGLYIIKVNNNTFKVYRK